MPPMSASAMLVSICICARSRGDLEERGRVEARRHRLAELDVARDHHAGDGRADHRVAQVGLVAGHLRLHQLHLRLGGLELLHGDVELRLRDEALADERAGARLLRLRPGEATPSALLRFASLCASAALNREGSSSARSWPSFTSLLKSACSLMIEPETCVPTFTEVTGFTLPLAETTCTTSPRVGGLEAPALGGRGVGLRTPPGIASRGGGDDQDGNEDAGAEECARHGGGDEVVLPAF